ncbi:MAG: DNA polymerase III subunit alpha, partial [Nitrospiraceae bacterium]
ARQGAPSSRGPSLPRQALFPHDAPLPEHRAVLLTKTPEGYANLCRLLSARHCDTSFDYIQTVSRYRNGLIILSDDEKALTAWAKASPHDLYVELTPGPKMYQALTFSRRSGLPPVATNRVHFVHREEFAVHRLLRAIALNTTLSRLPQHACCATTHWLMPPSILERQYPHVPEALENTCRIAEACHTDWNFKDTIFPAFRELSNKEAFELLQMKTYEGACKRYGELAPIVKKRIEDELAVIGEKGFADYFLVVEDIVRQAPRTCGRGSVAASIVSYCLEITHIDPIKHHLFFERFLNSGRQDPPDIDIDFPWDERDTILEWVFQKYGEQKAAMVANQNTVELRGALREVAKVYGIPAEEIARISARILLQKDFLWFEETPTSQTWAARISQALRLNAPWPEIIRAAVQVHGHFRHLSVHCGGVVIVPDEIRRYAPVEIAAKGVPVIQWEKDQAEEAGLVKIDLLGNRSLAVIRDALAAIRRHTGRQLDYAVWSPLDDPATQDLIRRGDTIGCFYIESPATRLLLKKLWGGMPPDRRAQADVFEYLVMVSSLVRPATNPFIQEFIRRAQGGTHDPLHPIAEHVLEETHGIMTYQEDVTKIAIELAGFSVTDADQLRKVLSKKHKERQLRDYCTQFYKGAAANSASRHVIDILWKMIMSFAGYSFCKPHSASYAQVSFKCAYLRTHHPAEFMAAVISNQGGFYSTFAYMSEARRMGLAILPPDVNASDWAYIGREKTLRIGLMQVKTLSRSLVKRITDDREQHGPFRSFQDFLTRVRQEQAQTRALIRAGCCDSLAGELTRPALLWRLYASRGMQARPREMAELPTFCESGRPLPIPDDYSKQRQLAQEAETLGFVWTCHPLELYRAHLRGVRYIDGCDMARHIGRRVTMIGWLITEKSVETKDGEPMEFVTFEDTTALYDATIFPDAYRRFCHLLVPDRPYLLHGTIEENFGTVTLTVQELQHADTRYRSSSDTTDPSPMIC